MNGGTLKMAASSGVDRIETLGTLNLLGGASTISLTPNGSAALGKAV